MKFVLSKKDFNILEKFDCAFDHIESVQRGEDYVSFEVKDVEDFQLDMTSDIVHIGMNNQDVVNKLGIEMYRVHDILMYSQKSI